MRWQQRGRSHGPRMTEVLPIITCDSGMASTKTPSHTMKLACFPDALTCSGGDVIRADIVAPRLSEGTRLRAKSLGFALSAVPASTSSMVCSLWEPPTDPPAAELRPDAASTASACERRFRNLLLKLILTLEESAAP